MAKGLTEKQRKILEFIIDFQKSNGFPPTIRELGDQFEIGSLRGVTVHLDALVRKGHMTRERTSRSIRVTGPDPRDVIRAAPSAGGGSKRSSSKSMDNGVRLPLVRSLGDKAGVMGDKIAADGQVERFLLVPNELAVPATDAGFVIRVGASGVRGEPVLPGDLMVVRPQSSAPEGDLVVMFSKGDFSVCRSEGHGEEQNRLAVNGAEGPEVIGRVVGLIRRY